jgi:hypothetical protein
VSFRYLCFGYSVPTSPHGDEPYVNGPYPLGRVGNRDEAYSVCHKFLKDFDPRSKSFLGYGKKYAFFVDCKLGLHEKVGWYEVPTIEEREPCPCGWTDKELCPEGTERCRLGVTKDE